MAELVTLVTAGIAGLVVGSFLNVVVYRVPRHLSIVHPPSHCTACEAPLSALDMVPVLSWLALRARCRHCGAAVSVRYPLVELATAVAFLGVALALRSHWLVPPVAVAAACTLVAGLVDADGAPVPAVVAVVLAVAAASLAPIDAALGHAEGAAWAALGAVLAGSAGLGAGRLSGHIRRVDLVLYAALGWTAGALWAWGGAAVTAWLLGAALVARTATSRRPPLALMLAGAFLVVTASAVIARF